MEKEIAEFNRYLERRYGKRSTAKHYGSDVAMFAKHVGYQAVEAVTSRQITGFIEAQQERGLKATTVNRRTAALHHFFEYVASNKPDEASSNPVNWFQHRVKQAQPLPRDASDSDVNRLFAVIDKPRDRALLGLLVGSGLRVGEACSLNLADLEDQINVAEPVGLRVKGKGEKERKVWVTPYWYQELTNWLLERPPSDSDAMFLNSRKQRLGVRGVQMQLKGYCQQAGVQFSPHQLRHTFARRLTEQEMPIEGISKLLGHAQIETTQRYTSGADPQLRTAYAQAMEQVAQATEERAIVEPSAPIMPRQTGQTDSAKLALILQCFDSFPQWLQTLLKQYVQHCWHRWQAHMAVSHARRLTRRLASIWEKLLERSPLKELAALQRSDVESWLENRTLAGISATTRRNDLSALRACLFFAQQQEMFVSPNVFRVPYPQLADPLPRHLSVPQFQQLLSTVLSQTEPATAHNLFERAWFLTLAHTGLRSCELLNLRLSDIDFDSQRLLIHQSKSGFGRPLYMTPQLTLALANYVAQRPPSNDDHLWLIAGKPMTASQLRKRLTQWGTLADVAVSPHRLRHTIATLLINNGMPIEHLQKLLGHRSLHVTQRYARLSDSVVKAQFQSAFEKIEGIVAIDWPLLPSLTNEQFSSVAPAGATV